MNNNDMNNHRQRLDYELENTTPTHLRMVDTNNTIHHNEANCDTAVTTNNRIRTENDQLTIRNHELHDNLTELQVNRNTINGNDGIITAARTAIVDNRNISNHLSIFAAHNHRAALQVYADILREDAPALARLAVEEGRPNIPIIFWAIFSMMILFPPYEDGYTSKNMGYAYGIKSGTPGWDPALKFAVDKRYLTRDTTGRAYLYDLHPRILQAFPAEARPVCTNATQLEFKNLVEEGRLIINIRRIMHSPASSPRRNRRRTAPPSPPPSPNITNP
jgi:hypothetical protein